MAEEYNLKNSELVIRKWKKKSELGTRQSSWEYEVGEQFVPKNLESEGLMESTSNPIFVRIDSVANFQWRIRNLPYPIATYNVTVDDDKQTITYKKPKEIIEMEKQMQAEFKKMKASKDGDVDCTPS
ncbi:hypothetical protein KUTeg_005393 [Tegillarca granosa]|uniref:Protein DPCD n=1 Tax=Tegillarca granosa TaxID=220873 RepID=A0ABQ9FJL8_TEGGR|nr:hypothetical protein KUTeg_005393 [Tegillarca granosa]